MSKTVRVQTIERAFDKAIEDVFAKHLTHPGRRCSGDVTPGENEAIQRVQRTLTKLLVRMRRRNCDRSR